MRVARCCYFHFHVGLYGNEGLLPARWQLRYSGKPLGEQLLASPTLLWLGPSLGLDTHTAMELLCLAGAALSLTATLLEAFRDSLVFFCLWVFYLSLYQVSLHLSVSDDSLGFPSLTGWLSFQVGQVFLYFQWWVFGIKPLLRLTLHSPKNVISCCCFLPILFQGQPSSGDGLPLYPRCSPDIGQRVTRGQRARPRHLLVGSLAVVQADARLRCGQTHVSLSDVVGSHRCVFLLVLFW